MKKSILILTIGILLTLTLGGCKYFLDDEIEKQDSSGFGGINFQDTREEQMRMQIFQTQQKQRTIRGGGRGRRF